MKTYIPKASPHASSLQNSVKEGISAEVVIRILDYYLIPFALFLGATEKFIGFLVAIPNFLSSFALIAAPLAVQVLKSRQKTIALSILLQAVILIPIAFLPFVAFPANVILLIALVAAFRSLGTLLGPPWGSLMSDYLLPKQRGRFFGSRSRIVGFAGILAGMGAGALLYFLKGFSELGSFMCVFLVAAFCRALSYFFTKKMKDIDHKLIPGFKGLKEHAAVFLSHFKNRNFARFASYVSTTTFATQMAYPFLSVWMLKGMGLNYLLYTSVHLASLAAGLFAFPIWGRHIDIAGTVNIQKHTSLLIAFIPLLWIIMRRQPLGLIAVEVFSGLIWAGFNLCTSNFIYNTCSSSQRVHCLVFFNFINGTMAFAGAAAGGFLAQHAPPFLGSPILFLFLLSAVLRLLADLIIAPPLAEIRTDVRTLTAKELILSVLGFQPIMGRNAEMDAENV
ncbi:MAG: MFS transporter [Candidatus Omnitrophota bacterium]